MRRKVNFLHVYQIVMGESSVRALVSEYVQCDSRFNGVDQSDLDRLQFKITHQGENLVLGYGGNATRVQLKELPSLIAFIKQALDAAAESDPSEWGDIRALIEGMMAKEGDRLAKLSRAGVIEKETESNCDYPCINCGDKNVFFTTIQTRSADEAATQFYRCLSCGKEWRQRG